MNTRKSILLAVVLLAIGASATALDLREGRILFSLDEKTARFTLSYLADATRNKYVPLLYDKEPRTSFPTLSWNGKTYRLGESPDFRFSVKRDGARAIVEYRSSFAVVRQTFRLLKSSGSADVDGLLVDFSIENLSGAAASVGLRLVWDTYLGERDKRHFELDGSGAVTGESSFAGASIPRRVLSPGDSGAALQIQLVGEGLSRPDRVVLANWKRINDSGWSFDIVPGRSFTLLPYSIDDSAVALYYEASDIKAGGGRTIRTLLGNRSDAGYSSPISEEPMEGSLGSSGPSDLKLESDPFVRARTDIAALKDILKRIDEMLNTEAKPTAAELDELRSLLEELKTHQQGY